MTEPRPFSEYLGGLVHHRAETGDRRKAAREMRQEYRALEAQMREAVESDPASAANVLEFTFHNNRDQKVRREAVVALGVLGENPDFRGKAIELLGIAIQGISAEVASEAESAVRKILRNRPD